MLTFRPAGRLRELLIRAGQEPLLLAGGTLIDATGRAPIERSGVLIERGRIARVGPLDQVPRPAGARVVDVTGRWLMPGLFDCHIHLNGEVTMDAYRRYLTPTPDVKVLNAARHAARALEAGFTTVRDVGPSYGISLKRAIGYGWIVGPRILTAACALTATGGHGDWTIFPLDWARSMELRGNLVDGVAECRHAVRKAFREGADLIKVMVSGGGITNHAADLIARQELSLEEVSAVVEEAHRRGARVAAHVVGVESARVAVEAGVDTIEHGVFEPDEAVLAGMVEKGISLVPTLVIFRWVVERGRAAGVFEGGVVAAGQWLERQHRLVRAAREAGVTIALGTDDNTTLGTERNAREIELLTEAGLSPMEALQAGTRNAARACGLEAEVGTLEPGKLADLLVLAADPLADPGCLYRPGTIVNVVQGLQAAQAA